MLNTREERIKIDYWNLFVKRCIQESKSIQEKNWISPDDVMSVSSTATIAIPGIELFRLWQYGLWSFQPGGTNLERFLPKNQNAQRILSNFVNWLKGEVSKSAKI